jgi:hypothetical protein
MKFIELPLPVDDLTPEGFKLVVAYAKGSKVFLPIYEMSENEEYHNCDWEGCGTFSHVASFDAEQKYKDEQKDSLAKEYMKKIVNLHNSDCDDAGEFAEKIDFIINEYEEKLEKNASYYIFK